MMVNAFFMTGFSLLGSNELRKTPQFQKMEKMVDRHAADGLATHLLSICMAIFR
jgi:hypothetical protein